MAKTKAKAKAKDARAAQHGAGTEPAVVDGAQPADPLSNDAQILASFPPRPDIDTVGTADLCGYWSALAWHARRWPRILPIVRWPRILPTVRAATYIASPEPQASPEEAWITRMIEATDAMVKVASKAENVDPVPLLALQRELQRIEQGQNDNRPPAAAVLEAAGLLVDRLALAANAPTTVPAGVVGALEWAVNANVRVAVLHRLTAGAALTGVVRRVVRQVEPGLTGAQPEKALLRDLRLRRLVEQGGARQPYRLSPLGRQVTEQPAFRTRVDQLPRARSLLAMG